MGVNAYLSIRYVRIFERINDNVALTMTGSNKVAWKDKKSFFNDTKRKPDRRWPHR